MIVSQICRVRTLGTYSRLTGDDVSRVGLRGLPMPLMTILANDFERERTFAVKHKGVAHGVFKDKLCIRNANSAIVAIPSLSQKV